MSVSTAQLRAIVRNKKLCSDIELASSDAEVDALIAQNLQVISNTVAALSAQASAPSPQAPAVSDSDAAIEYFISTVAGHSATLTPQVVKDAISKHPDWSGAYSEALSKGGDAPRMYLVGNLDLIGELFAYI